MEANGKETLLVEDVMDETRNGRAWPSFSPDGGRILFVGQWQGVRTLSILDLLSREVATLGPGEFPAWSPDGERIAFTTPDEEGVSQVFVMAADGSERRQLTRGAACTYPSWSPEGARLVFCREVGERTDLFVMSVDGNHAVALTATPGRSERYPSWSPDGSSIAYTAIPEDSPNGWQRSVFLITAAGGPPRQITPSAHDHTRPVWVPPSALVEADYMAID
jgi:TolB protein